MDGRSDFRRWDELIPDALGLIFKKLSLQEILTVVPAVCKSWQAVVLGPYCWQQIDLEQWSGCYVPEEIHRMLQLLIPRSCGSLLELSVGNDISDESVMLIGMHSRSLQTLKIKYSGIEDRAIELMAPMLSKITSLDLSHCTSIGAPALRAIGEHCKHLEYLDITGCWSAHLDEELENRFSKLNLLGPDYHDYSSDYWSHDNYADDMSYDDFTDPYQYEQTSDGYATDDDFFLKMAAWSIEEDDDDFLRYFD